MFNFIKKFHVALVLFLFFIISVFFIAFITECNCFSNVPKVSLEISENLASDFVLLKKGHFSAIQMNSLFESMYSEGDRFCSMLMGQRKMDYKLAARYIQKGRLSKYLKKIYGGFSLSFAAKSGCWNFFQLNDFNSQLAFLTIKKKYKHQIYNCYSVGLMHPYTMHSTLGCKTLNIIDFDWRIIDAHRQMLLFFNENKFSEKENISKILRKLRLGWRALSKKHVSREKVTLETLCGTFNDKFCIEVLSKFQKKYQKLKNIRLLLSGLHEAKIVSKKNELSVFYLSNALTSKYMSLGEYHQTIKNISNSLKNNEKAIVIHHYAVSLYYEIYEIYKKNNNLILKKVCESNRKKHSKVASSFLNDSTRNDSIPPICL